MYSAEERGWLQKHAIDPFVTLQYVEQEKSTADPEIAFPEVCETLRIL